MTDVSPSLRKIRYDVAFVPTNLTQGIPNNRNTPEVIKVGERA